MKSFVVFMVVMVGVVSANKPNKAREAAACAVEIDRHLGASFVPQAVAAFTNKVADENVGGLKWKVYTDYPEDFKAKLLQKYTAPQECSAYIETFDDVVPNATPCYNNFFSPNVDAGTYTGALEDNNTPNALLALMAANTCKFFL